MALFVCYALGIAAVLGYTLFYLPFPQLTHQMSFYLNTTLLGFASLLSFFAYRQEKHFRAIFFQFWFLFAALALSGPIAFHCSYWCESTDAIVAYVTVNLIVHALFLWTTAKIFFHYVFHDEKRWAINTLSAVVVLPTSVWLFWPLSWNPAAILTLPSAASAATFYLPLMHGELKIDIATLILLVAFFLHKLRVDRPVGVFADTVIGLLGVFYLIDTIEVAAGITSLELLSISQWALGITLTTLIVTLILRLKYKSQTIAHYYESQCLSYDPRIGRRIGLFDRFVLRCFFDPEKVGQRVFLGAGPQKMTVRRHSPRVARPAARD
jgi:hypothetical protein